MIEYIDEIHTYLYNGVIIPSVSQVLREKVFPNKYDGVPKWILEKKAVYGSEVHSLIEKIEAGEIVEVSNTYVNEGIKQYGKLKEENNFKVLEQEQIVCYEGLYAGRFDMIFEMDGKKCLCDIKTTAELDKKYLAWQLSMYELAYGEAFDKFYCIWLPKGGLGKLVEIERIEKEKILEIVR